MGIIYTHYDVLDVDATSGYIQSLVQIGPVVLENILKPNIYGHGGHLGHEPNIVQFNFIFLV